MMLNKPLLFTAVTTLAAANAAAQLHIFNNGEVADADKINQNFEYVLQNASGGCSATQQESSVVIECADGTSGVLASAGTVVIYPVGQMGELPDIAAIPAGAIVAKDSNDVILGEVKETDVDGNPIIAFSVDYGAPIGVQPKYGVLFSRDGLVEFAPDRTAYIYFSSQDCTGPAFYTDDRSLYRIGNKYYVQAFETAGQLLMSPRRRGAYVGADYVPSPDCEAGDYVINAKVAREYIPPAEILNAAFPVRIEQLP
jgi:hypothetical protein